MLALESSCHTVAFRLASYVDWSGHLQFPTLDAAFFWVATCVYPSNETDVWSPLLSSCNYISIYIYIYIYILILALAQSK
jgi:hypothetical protein